MLTKLSSARTISADSLDTAVPVIQRALTKASKEGIDIEQTEELVSQAVATWAHRTYRRSPLIIPVSIDA